MFINKNFGLKRIWKFSGVHVIWLSLWSATVTCFIEFLHYHEIYALKVPWLPVSLVGTAVAFYVGFKNNSAYDRLWEARKIWGGIVNSSRMWGSKVRAYINNQFRDIKMSDVDLHKIHTMLIYKHIAWLYTLRKQLLIPTSWEHISQNKMMEKHTKSLMKMYGIDHKLDELTEKELLACLSEDEVKKLLAYQNTATQLIDKQSQIVTKLRSDDLLDDFRQVELQKILNDFYTLQGQAERIKKFPLPRQYGSMSLVFVGLFIFLLPFALVTVFHDLGDWGAWLSMPFTVIVGWVFVMMELIGDYSENPFEGLGNDIPMLSLCRTIEIDLKEMLGETDLPDAILAKDGVMM